MKEHPGTFVSGIVFMSLLFYVMLKSG